jgi:uncharacterized membrane protein YkgB
MRITKLQISLPIIGMSIAYILLWIGGFNFDHRGVDTMLLLMLVLSIGFIGFVIAKEMEIT